jgi:ABC-2 type transport system permease protein
VYGIVPVGSYFTIYVFAGFYLVAILGLGLLLSTYAQTQQQSMLVSFFVTMIFNLMSGLYTPLKVCPYGRNGLPNLTLYPILLK